MQKVSVENAVRVGSLTVNLPAVILIFSFMIGGLVLVGYPPVLPFTVFFGGFALSWVYWSLAITKWKLWAYANVEDLVELKKAAVRANLIWPDNSLFNKTEIKLSQEASIEKELLEKADATFVRTDPPFHLTARGVAGIIVMVTLIGLLTVCFARG
jgi:hypothetical protein